MKGLIYFLNSPPPLKSRHIQELRSTWKTALSKKKLSTFVIATLISCSQFGYFGESKSQVVKSSIWPLIKRIGVREGEDDVCYAISDDIYKHASQWRGDMTSFYDNYLIGADIKSNYGHRDTDLKCVDLLFGHGQEITSRRPDAQIDPIANYYNAFIIFDRDGCLEIGRIHQLISSLFFIKTSRALADEGFRYIYRFPDAPYIYARFDLLCNIRDASTFAAANLAISHGYEPATNLPLAIADDLRVEHR